MTGMIASESVDYDPFAGAAVQRVVPTTEAQREIWLADRLDSEASLAYNESVSLNFAGPLDARALDASLEAIVARHEALRATFSHDGLEMHVAEEATLPAARQDLSSLTGTAQEAAIAKLLAEEVETPFDLSAGPLIRARLVKLGSDRHRLVLTAHHIVCDGWSFAVIARDLLDAYRRETGVAAEAPADAAAFGDFAIDEAAAAGSSTVRADEQFWLARLSGSLPVLELPTDRPRPSRRTFGSRRVDIVLDEALSGTLRGAARKAGVTLFSLLAGTFAACIARLAGSDDVLVGVPSATQAGTPFESMVGHAVNMLPMRFAVDLDAPTRDLLAHVQRVVLDSQDHTRCTFGAILKKLQIARDPSRPTLLAVAFNLDSPMPADALACGPLATTFTSNPRHFENFELFLNVSWEASGLRLECQYNTQLFDEATVRRWLSLYTLALQRCAADATQPVAALLAPSEADVALLAEFNATGLEVEPGVRVDTLIARQAATTPDAIAVTAGGTSMSYRELDAQANALAAALRERGVRTGELVGLACRRSAKMLVALLGILKSGAGYVPLDPTFPTDRLEFMAQDSTLRFVVVDDASEQAVGAEPWKFGAAEPVGLDALVPTLAAPSPAGSANDVAYVIYTSGSTGRPKGVRVPHRTVVNLLASLQKVPGFRPDHSVLAVTTLSFDIAVSEVIMPLTIGARIVVADHAEASDGDRLAALIEGERVTLIDATPSTWRLLLAAGWRGRHDILAICTGEPLPPDLGRALLPRVGELWNGYGPTETTVWSSFHRVERIDGAVPIGKPVANTLFHVLDGALRPLPVGVIGELYIAGAGVTLGYLARPELTAERFLPDPFAADPQARLYRTGDLGRWRSDGVLECLGRIDNQVKVRGYRIELGEIESNLVEHSSVARAVVMTREDTPGDVRIVAYIVPNGAMPSADALRAHLAAKLPEYMLPQHVIEVAAMPLLPNGKLDRKALPVPGLSGPGGANVRKLPQSATEHLVLEAMEAVLRLPGLSTADDFFALGGHSLLAAQLAQQLSAKTKVRVPMRTVFDVPTTARLAAWIDAESKKGRDATAPIEVRADQSRAPASLMQQRVWFLEQFEPGRRTFNTPSAHRLRGPLDVEALERAFNEMVRRQATLRTIFAEEDGVPYQVVLPELEVSLTPVEDLSDLPAAERDASLAAILQARVDELFDLRRAPLFRVGLYKVADGEHVLFFMPHHIVWDGWSFDLFYEEMAALYGAYSRGLEPSLAPLPKSYGDFAQWQQQWLEGEDMSRQLGYWTTQLAEPPPPLDLPADRARPARATGGGSTVAVASSSERTEAARRLGSGAGATLFMTLLAAYAALLHRLTGQTDLVVGTPVRGRHSADVEKVMGFFVNALPLRIRVDPRARFTELLAHVRDVVLNGFSHPDVPFERLVRALNVPRDESRSPVYQAFFSFQDARDRIRRWGDLTQEQVHLFQAGSADDIGLWFLEHPQGLAGGLTFNTDILSAESARRFAARYDRLLDAAIASPQASIAQLALMPDVELQALRQWNATTLAVDLSPNVAELVERQARRTPTATALRSDGTSWSYAALMTQVHRLARELRWRGVGRGSLVGLCVNRSAQMIVAQLAILESGAAYVPLDPRFPRDRLAYMAEDAQLALLVTQASLRDVVPWDRDRTVLVDDAAIQNLSDAPLEPDAERDAQPADPAYVIYTSGSTGRPKGVMVPHAAVVNFLASMAREPGLRAEDRLVAVTTLSFDIAVLELLLPLTVGAQVVLASAEQVVDGHALRDLIESSEATAMQATPSTWQMLIEAGWSGPPGFKALIGGEGLPLALAQLLLRRTGELWNMYGPTETTVWSTLWKVEQPENGIFIGHPIANTSVHVLDASGQPCAIGAIGEIYIGGSGVTLGYLRRPELTGERFVADPFGGASTGQRLYRTGDRGRWRADGVLEHLGRLDFQVKVRGYRIELGEIENNLLEHPAVQRALVIVREDRPGDVRLVAYIVARGTAPAAGELREHLRKTLPDYMLPQHIVALPSIPLLPNGKVDRHALPAPSDALPVDTQPEGERTPQEQAVAEIWQSLLGVERMRVTDNFFDLGGHSMLALKLIARIEKHFGRRLPVSILMEAPTVRSLVARLSRTESVDTLVPIRPGNTGAPMFLVHDGDGETLLYRGLALGLRDGQAVYGLQPYGANGHPMLHTRIPDMAAHHLNRIRRVQPHGPYLIGGLCAGGVIAFEVARQLEAQGEQVAMLALIDVADVAAPLKGGRVSARRLSSFAGAFSDGDGRSGLEQLTKGAATASAKLMNLIVYESKTRLHAMAATRNVKSLQEHLDAGTKLPDELRQLTVREIYMHARSQYRVDGRLRGNVVLFRATRGRGDLADEPVTSMHHDPLLGWEQRVHPGRLVAIDVPGGHSSMLQEPHVAVLAAEMQRCIDGALAGPAPDPR